MTYKMTRGDIQNRFRSQFIAPIMINLDFKTVYNNIVNYKALKRKNIREDMGLVGVFDSLEKLEYQGTSYEKIQKDLTDKTTELQSHKIKSRERPFNSTISLIMGHAIISGIDTDKITNEVRKRFDKKYFPHNKSP